MARDSRATWFYEIDAVIERTAAGLGLVDIGLDRDVTELSGGQRTKGFAHKAFTRETDYSIVG